MTSPPTVDSDSRKLARNAGWSLLGFAVPSLVMLVAVPVYIWFIGVRDYGLFALANSLVGLAGVLNLGLGHATTKFVAEYVERGEGGALRSLVYATLVFYAAVGLIGWVVLYLVSAPVVHRALDLSGAEADRAVWILRVVAAGFIPTVAFSVAAALFNGLQQYRASQILGIARSALSLAVGLVVLLLGTGLEGLAVGLVAVLWVSCGAGFAVGIRRLPPSDRGLAGGGRLFRRVISFSFYTSLTSVASLAVNQLDKVLLGSLLGLEAVSVYSVAQAAAMKINVFNTSVARVLMPFFSARSVDETRPMLAPLVASWRASIAAGAWIAALGLATAPWALELWLDDGFAAAVLPVFAIFVINYGLNTVNIVPYFYLLGRDRPGAITWPALFGSAVLLAGIAILAPVAGLAGAAAATVFYPLISLSMSAAAARMTRGYTRATGVLPGSLGFALTVALAAIAGFVAGVGLEAASGTAWIAGPGAALVCGGLLGAAALHGRRRNSYYANVFEVLARLRRKAPS